VDEHENEQKPPGRFVWPRYLALAGVTVLDGVIAHGVRFKLVGFGIAVIIVVVAIAQFWRERRWLRRLGGRGDPRRPRRDGWIYLLVSAGLMILVGVLITEFWGRLLGFTAAAALIATAVFAFRQEWRWLKQHDGIEG
jgi:hypothetical protein